MALLKRIKIMITNEYKNKNVYVTTEEGKKQELLETEFNILFTFLKN